MTPVTTAKARRREVMIDVRHMRRCGFAVVDVAHELTTGPLSGLWHAMPPRERVAVLSMAGGWR